MDNLVSFLNSELDINGLEVKEVYSYYDFPRFLSITSNYPDSERSFFLLNTEDSVELDLPERSDFQKITNTGSYWYMSWVLTETSNETLVKFENNEITMLDLFMKDYSLNLWELEEMILGNISYYKMELVEFEKMERENKLPAEGIFLDGERK